TMVATAREALSEIPIESTDPATRSLLENRQIALDDRRANLPGERGETARVMGGLPVRSQAFTPLSREGEAIGVMIVNRNEVRPFQQGDLGLMTGLPDQAVIAIENARLLSELRARTDELARSVGELRALGEVGQAVNSTLDAETVLRTIVTKAVELSATDA